MQRVFSALPLLGGLLLLLEVVGVQEKGKPAGQRGMPLPRRPPGPDPVWHSAHTSAQMLRSLRTGVPSSAVLRRFRNCRSMSLGMTCRNSRGNAHSEYRLNTTDNLHTNDGFGVSGEGCGCALAKQGPLDLPYSTTEFRCVEISNGDAETPPHPRL